MRNARHCGENRKYEKQSWNRWWIVYDARNDATVGRRRWRMLDILEEIPEARLWIKDE